jgi:hypothetical protein
MKTKGIETPIEGFAKPVELADRSGDGVDVSLVWLPASGSRAEHIVICVSDRRDGTYFEIDVEPYLALEVFYHPFVYRDFCRTHCQLDQVAV